MTSPKESSHLIVNQKGNRIDVFYAGHNVWIEVSGIEMPILKDYSFALWMLLPLSMQLQSPMHIVGSIDSVVLENAIKIAKIWEMWMPEKFRSTPLSADTLISNITRSSAKSKLFLYSGGVDSSYMLLQPDVVIADSYALTIHGLDYKPKNEEGFLRLLHKTEPLLQRLGIKRIVIKTNLGLVVKDLSINHGFCLAGCGFLFRDIFRSVYIAADYNFAQEMLAFPWGTNHITNPLFAGSNYQLKTMNSDITRTQKIAFLDKDVKACNSITFCGEWKHRPDNCGRCDKCIRTKAMFLVEKGSFPAIFKCNSFDKRHVNSINLNTRKELTFISELVGRAEEKRRLDRLLGLELRYEKAIQAFSAANRKSMLSKQVTKIRKMLIWR